MNNSMKSLAFATITQLQEKIEAKEISPQEVIEYFIDRFRTYDSQLESALEIFDIDSIVQASASQGPLLGIPGLIKDNICQKGRIASCASKIIANFQATYDATVISRLKRSGAPLIGRANMDEFAMGSSTETSAFQYTKNPWNTERVPGGSSGGSAAAVAAGLVPWSLGSETGGSVRQPAALCGIVGLKPTYGLISRSGLVAYGSSLDQIGIFARTVRDNAIVLSSMAGVDVKDSTTLHVQPNDYTQHITGTIKEGLSIGIIENAMQLEGMDPEMLVALENVISVYESLGARIKRISIPTMDYAASVYFILSRAEAASNLARFDGIRYGLRAKDIDSLRELYTKTRHDGFGDVVKQRILVGNYVLSTGHAGEFYENAQKTRNLMRKEFNDVFKDVDVLLAPVSPGPAFKFGAFEDNALQMDLQDYFTCAQNIAGIPALALPCGMSSTGLPLGFQLIGPKLSEGLLYQTAHAYEQTTEWHTKHPRGYE